MQLHDLLDHGEPEPAAAVLPARGIRLPEALPDLVLILRCDAGTVVRDAEHSFAVRVFVQRDAHPHLLPAVFIGVLQQIDDHARHQSRVARRLNIGLDVQLHFCV